MRWGVVLASLFSFVNVVLFKLTLLLIQQRSVFYFFVSKAQIPDRCHKTPFSFFFFFLLCGVCMCNFRIDNILVLTILF